MYFSAFIFAALPLAALAGNSHLGSRRSMKHRDVPKHIQSRKTFTLTDKYAGQNFFDGWDFFTGSDPTHGNVNFVSSQEAFQSGLAYVQGDNTVVMRVDNTTQLSPGANRNSVRIGSTKTYNGGLFIADIFSMPHGCSVWPAWWMVGPNWPSGGEIDILEGVHDGPMNQYTLHTTAGCSLDSQASGGGQGKSVVTGAVEAFTAHVLGTTCESGPSGNAGCGFLDTDASSYGKAFNLLAGGVYATLWDSTGISVWHFARPNVPADITAGTPQPAGWGTPAAFWSSTTCDSSHFHDQQLVFDITLCGDWAGATYASAGCPGTCADAVANPSNYDYARWAINYVAVYN